MNIKQALKQKNKLIKEITEKIKLMQQYNSVEEGNERPYSINELYVDVTEKSKELSELKARIHRANAPVLEDIFLMAEMKSTIQALKKMDCTSGKSNRDRYSSAEIILTVEMNLVERNNKIKDLEDRIEQIQDVLDVFNSNTEI
jgi:CII-binding regulator of phage lambda lysogenization HflD